MKKIAIASDHGGFEMKEALKSSLEESGYEVKDFGCQSSDSVNYPDYAVKLSKYVVSENILGILICGTGIGMSISANKIKGIRAALCHNTEYAKLSRQHNDANVLCLGGRFLKIDEAKEILNSWLSSEFEGGRHQLRVDIIKELE